MKQFAEVKVMTAGSARRMNIQTSRHYGYYVIATPKPSYSLSNHPLYHICAWCKTKATATSCAEEKRKYDA